MKSLEEMTSELPFSEQSEETGQSLSVIVPHYEDLENLHDCLECLGRQTLERSRFEIVVVDNASPCGIDVVEAAIAGRARLVLSHQKGAGVTRNVGVSASTGELLAFVDSDCSPDPSYLVEGLKALDRFDIVGGAVRVDIAVDGSPTPYESFEMIFAFQNERYISKKGFTVTAALFVSRRIFEAVGPFRNDVSEDLEWGQRAQSAGFSLGFAPNAIVGHPARRSWSQLEKKWRRLTEEAFGLACLGRFGVTRWLIRSWLVLASLVPHAMTAAFSPKLRRVSHRLDAVRVLIRLRTMRFMWAHQIVFRRQNR